ncbi:hypothetical protein D3C72_1429500 [compost metagenome]
MLSIVRAAQVLAPPRSPLAFDGITLRSTLRRRGSTGVEHGRDENLARQRRVQLVARHHADAGGQVGTGLLARQIERRTLAGQPGTLFVGPLKHRVPQLQRAGKRMLRRQRVGHRHHAGPGSCQGIAHGAAVVQVTRHKSATMKVHHQRRGLSPLLAAIHAHAGLHAAGHLNGGIGMGVGGWCRFFGVQHGVSGRVRPMR